MRQPRSPQHKKRWETGAPLPRPQHAQLHLHVVANARAVHAKLLQHYLGNKKLKTPDNEYENIYVIFAKDLGDVELHHLLF